MIVDLAKCSLASHRSAKHLLKRFEEQQQWSNVVRMLKDVGRFKGSTEEVQRQRQLKKGVDDLQEHIYSGNIAEARQALDRLAGQEELRVHSLHRVVEVWNILVRPSDRSAGIEGLGGELTQNDVERWDSGTLCAHPSWDDDQLRKNELLWDDWWCEFTHSQPVFVH